MNAQTTAVQTANPPAPPELARPSWRPSAILLIVCLFAALLGLWHWLDHALPPPDDSSYIIGSFQYADLLRHPKFWRLDWWHSMLSVNPIYPPAAIFFNGILRLVFGTGHWVNALSVMLFNALLTGSVFGITKLLTGNWKAGVIAACLINFYPETSCMFHGFALDAPLMAAVALGIFALAWWRSAPSWGRAVACGLTMGAVCLTKQIAAAYLIGPGVYFLAESVLSDLRARRFHLSLQLIVAAALTVLSGVPWVLTNMTGIQFLAKDNQAYMGKLTLAQVFPSDIAFYARSLPIIMSPLLFGSLAVSIFLLGKKEHKALVPLFLSALGGVLMISTLTWAFPSLRYVAPAMIACAIFTGCAMAQLLEKRLSVVLVWVVLALAAGQFISFNFTPYPLSTPAFAAQVSEKLGVNVVETFGLSARDKRESRTVHSNPSPAVDWGQQWAVATIDRYEGHKQVYLNILPDFVQLNGNTFELVARTQGSLVKPTTSRRWTVMGDVVRFDPTVALYYQWYLLKSKVQGNILRDEESEKNYARLIDFVKSSGKFTLIAAHDLPDGSTMYLYRQK